MKAIRKPREWNKVDWRLPNKEIAKAMGVWTSDVSKKRGQLAGGIKAVEIDPDSLDWTKGNKDLSAETGLHPTSLAMIRKRLGKPPAQRGRPPGVGNESLKRHARKCPVCGDEFEVRPSSLQVTCRKKECTAEQKKRTRTGKTLKAATKKKIGDGVRHGKSNKVAWATRWAPEAEAKMKKHTERTGESRVATLERLVRDHL